MKKVASPLRPTTGGVAKPLSNAPNIHHVKAPLNVSHGKPPKK